MVAATDRQPTRTCVGCRRRGPASTLVRVVRTSDGGLRVGRTLPGRGAWVCPETACAASAARKGTWARALHGPVRAEAAAGLVEEIALRPGTLDGAVGPHHG